MAKGAARVDFAPEQSVSDGRKGCQVPLPTGRNENDMHRDRDMRSQTDNTSVAFVAGNPRRLGEFRTLQK